MGNGVHRLQSLNPEPETDPFHLGYTCFIGKSNGIFSLILGAQTYLHHIKIIFILDN